MRPSVKQRIIQVISYKEGLLQTVRESVEGLPVEIDYASDWQEGLMSIGKRRPDLVILGDLGGEEDAAAYYMELMEGWISRHSTLLIVERSEAGLAYTILDDGDLKTGIGDHSFLPLKKAVHVKSEDIAVHLRETILKKLAERENKLRAAILDGGCYCLTWEQIPGMGAFERRQELVLENARRAALGGEVCAISIVDNPGGNPAIATEILCSEIHHLGIEPMVHLAFRDRNRNQVESLLYQLAALDINNLLILTGDYPSSTGFRGTARPVFDLDAVNGLELIAEMNRGMEHEIMRRRTRLASTDFFAGTSISPFKIREAEVMGQYFKLSKKISAGADFAITQIGYDARKLHELQLWLKMHRYDLPVLASIQVLSLTAARAMHGNRVPGAVVTDKLLAQVAQEAESADKGRAAALERAAKMYAITKGLGYRGACLSGQTLKYEDVEFIIHRGRELSANWTDLVPGFDYPQENGFYYFEKERDTGLNSSRIAGVRRKATRTPVYYLSSAVHQSLFEPRSPLFKPVRAIAALIDSNKTAKKMLGSIEYWFKAALYGCKDCGDCGLFDVAYLCPVSQCPKNQRNGPCGGSYDGWCEVYPGEKQCIWVRAYQRLSVREKDNFTGDFIVPPSNWELWQTSSWLNYFLGRDHVSKRAGIKPPQQSHPADG
ncbi:MAG: methylenetetrahydrofolate reductase C-terminal domain-containing protein [Dehalococcoidales bacterium]|nr:methylenetetrahydrofolate reductase C-terminal domain-containing protein [Dehalococcoidales bacterium]